MRGKHSLLYIHQLVHKRSKRGHLYKGTQIDTEQGRGGGGGGGFNFVQIWGRLIRSQITCPDHSNYITVNKALVKAERSVKN